MEMAIKHNEPLFDTYMAIKEISDQGISENAAATIIKYTVLAQQIYFSRLASKEDMETTKMTLQKEIKHLEISMQKENKNLELSMQKETKRLDDDIKRLELSTQKEIKNLELSMQKENKNLEISMQKEIAVSARKTVIWISGMLLANTGLIVSLMKLL